MAKTPKSHHVAHRMSGFFNNGGSYVEAHPDFKPKHWAEICVPLVIDGPEIHGPKAQLLARASAGLCAHDGGFGRIHPRRRPAHRSAA
jgi:hypothetical protein